MTVILSLRWLDEPAYILDAMSPPGPMRGYFTRLRSRSSALEEIALHPGHPVDLARLVKAGTLIEFPAGDEGAVRATLAGLTIRTPKPLRSYPDRGLVLLGVPDRPGRAIAVDTKTVHVLERADGCPLGMGVSAVAASLGLAVDDLWRGVIHELTGVLCEGVGAVSRPPSETLIHSRIRHE